ncbi:hypothetical protein CEXT_391771 [Caerostris extrusa]|uniref:Uncharacterized protein n=1 Tax=Caerostris extrusa TaxID=172846 RepID=A0AAV4UEI2_CAEEX|nr:hypothetical protein CEXT_391771 [Caerostris extrusa]
MNILFTLNDDQFGENPYFHLFIPQKLLLHKPYNTKKYWQKCICFNEHQHSPLFLDAGVTWRFPALCFGKSSRVNNLHLASSLGFLTGKQPLSSAQCTLFQLTEAQSTMFLLRSCFSMEKKSLFGMEFIFYPFVIALKNIVASHQQSQCLLGVANVVLYKIFRNALLGYNYNMVLHYNMVKRGLVGLMGETA